MKNGSTTDSTDGAESSNSPHEIGHVTIKPPAFYRKSPDAWFRTLESQFALGRITTSSTKYHHVMACLPEDIAIGLDVDDTCDYDKLKAAILKGMKANKHELIEQALSKMTLGDKKPSQLVSEIRRRFAEIGITADEAIVKSRLLSALPINLQTALVGHDDVSLEKYASIADSMISVAAAESPFVNVAAMEQRRRPENTQHFSRANTVRPFHPDQRPRICNAHIFYADRAKTCRRWCKWPGRRPRQLNDNAATPAQSRSATPAHSRSNSPTNL